MRDVKYMLGFGKNLIKIVAPLKIVTTLRHYFGE